MSAFSFTGSAAERLEATYRLPDIIAQREATLRVLDLQPNEAVVDIGCGPGYLCESIAETVGRTGHVVGLDISDDLLARARERSRWSWLEYKRSDAIALETDDAAYDAAVSTQVLEYVPDVPKALAEMKRVLRPGGRALIVDTDWDSVIWYSADRARMAAVMRAFEGHCVHPRLPRELPKLLRDAGLALEAVTIHPIIGWRGDTETYSYRQISTIAAFVGRSGLVPEDTVKAWRAEQEQLHRDGGFFFSINRYIFVARKPA